MSKEKTARQNEGGFIGNAPPTSPGGMKQAALAEELIERHGYTPEQMDEFREFTATGRRKKTWRLDAWGDMVEIVAQERRNRELEADLESASEPPTYVEPGSLLIKDPDTYDYIFNGHAGAGPSASERWMSCTASLAASRKFLETLTVNQQKEFAVSSQAAQQGTTAHAAAETKARVILGEIDEAEADLTLMELAFVEDEGVSYDDDMEDFIQEYVDLVKMYHDEGREVLIETRVAAAVWLDDDTVHEVKGSADFGAMPTGEDNYLVVGDLKYGNGVDVDVEENPQARIYALGMLARLADDEGNLPDLDGVRYYIAQPRLGGIKKWEESIDDLLDWRDEVLAPALALALAGPEGGATFNPEPKACQFCPARGSCAALGEQVLSSASDLFDTVIEAEMTDGGFDTGLLDDTRLGELLTQAQSLSKIADSLKSEAQRRLYRGRTVKGYQLVNYQPPRSWTEGADEVFEDDERMWAKKLLSPTQAEKIAKTLNDPSLTERVEGMTHKPDVRPVVAPEGDRRKTWTGAPPEQLFPETT